MLLELFLQALSVLLLALIVEKTPDNLGPIADLITGIVNKSSIISENLSPYRQNDGKDISVFPTSSSESIETYDFIIVGASPSGSALANRLSEVGKWNIIVLEAGGMPSPLTTIPVQCTLLSFTAYDWGAHTEPQEQHCRGNVEALTYVKTNLTDPEHPTWPDIELIFLAGTPATDFGLYIRQIFNIPKETFNVVWKPLIGKPGFTVLTQLMHPISVGYIRLRSKDSLDEPRYFTNFFSDPENIDVRAHIAGIREGQRIVSQPTMQRYGARIVDTPIPGCANFTFDTDEYWECAIRELTGSLWHQQSTCKMGPKEDKTAVVDAKLRVHGLKGLRVIDTGVIPRSISAHLTGPAYMIGEKGADIIKQDWGELRSSDQS
ncbi:unnamed protein product [Acanthoscelides obtectus]|uniref:Glucose-methanol-choline oxidoreductase C-terminal domain-containing protein n=2 Tax=Acanthoscelides obtectus TaxID=200917 RepID=A0A9P0L589_ACAOB|nr:unnamed protein product [Acanthoscelides obtectus]CAK1650887.1 Glucose dehydrogenase [FAD, quinone] [Acanthoscelides obtectus]